MSSTTSSRERLGRPAEDAGTRGMAPGPRAVAGVAVRPVMDLSDRRVIAYDASPRAGGGETQPTALLDAALFLALSAGPAPLLVHVDPLLLFSSTFDLLAKAASARSATSEVVWMLPAPRRDPAGAADALANELVARATRQHGTNLRQAGFPVGFDGVAPLSMSWADAVDARPAFLLIEPVSTEKLHEDSYQAALAGLLAFGGRLGARVVAQGVANLEAARTFMEVGVFYGIGDYLHGPVVLDGALAREGDTVVRPSWFRERSVRKLPTETSRSGVHFVPAVRKTEIVGDRQLAGLLIECSGTLSNAGEPAAVLAALAETVPALVEFDRLAIFEADWDSYRLRPRVLVGEALQPLVGVTYTLNTGITGWAFLQAMAYRCGRTGDHPEAAPIPDQEEADESLLVIPLISGDQRLGALDLWRDGIDQFSEHDLERATLLGKLGADAWRAAEQRADLSERLVTDTVTGLLNKRWWDELAPREAAQVLRAKGSIALLLIDLDGFKAVNDSHGHASGDVVLKHVARVLSSTVRSGDTVVRYGGDEFVLLLRDCDEKSATDVARDVQSALAGLPSPIGEGAPVTASIGIAFFPEHGPSLADVAVNADLAMYRAKALGRDQISCCSPIVCSEADLGTVLGTTATTTVTGGLAVATEADQERSPSAV
ncbi:MAG: diguanylate cyclase [Acidimicrobiales bacterium]